MALGQAMDYGINNGQTGSWGEVNDSRLREDDWVPGDWGHITSTGFNNLDEKAKRRNVGLEGENVLCVGAKRFGKTSIISLWGIGFGERERSLEGWKALVGTWFNGGGSSLDSVRRYPMNGLRTK
jgi:hypothetical protein